MSNRERTLVNGDKREEIAAFMAALRRAKEDLDGAKAYARKNPVCSRCEKSQLKGMNVLCIRMSDGVRCCRCRALKQSCPRLVDFWITHIAAQLGQPEERVRDLYALSSARGSGGATGSKKDDEESYVESPDEDEARTVDDQEKVHFSPPDANPKSSTSSSKSHREVRVTHDDTDLAPLKQEIELLKHRAETAEGNFVALVGRVQDFRTSLRSEIHTMSPGVAAINGLSKLSAAMETTIDDSGLYMRDIPDALKQSRSKWGIQYGTQAEVKTNEGGSKVGRQIRQRSPEPANDNMLNMLKRRKI